jgi:hypothetical protein
MPELLIGVEITAREAEVFRKMREFGAFDLCDANVTLHFGPSGRLLKIDKHTYLNCK